MKKFAAGAGATVVALAGLSGLSIAPAAASPFQNCEQARNAGVTNIRIGDPNYSPDLDRGGDGVACESEGGAGSPSMAAPQAPAADAPQAPAAADPAAVEPWTWDNCSEAFANGVSNIPAGTPGYGTHLDSDLDGIGCELDGSDAAAFPTPVDGSAADQAASAAAEASQVTEIPAGAAETGVPVKADSNPAGIVGLSVLALGAVAGSGLLVRRAVKA
ncbi:excalibur calcium-binding domain-containing protein [Kocuria palustris]|uniref:excalibur calcium-binding domain-containing protein n=1 Tax=Kocuria palustris TaxID=71999 RepID=UPI0035DAC03E